MGIAPRGLGTETRTVHDAWNAIRRPMTLSFKVETPSLPVNATQNLSVISQASHQHQHQHRRILIDVKLLRFFSLNTMRDVLAQTRLSNGEKLQMRWMDVCFLPCSG